MKNVVAQIIIKIREVKRKPKLHDFLRLFRDNPDSIDKERIILKLKQLYSDEPIEFKPENDKKFNSLNAQFDRLAKIVYFQNEVLRDLDKKLSKLITRKLKRIRRGPKYLT